MSEPVDHRRIGSHAGISAAQVGQRRIDVEAFRLHQVRKGHGRRAIDPLTAMQVHDPPISNQPVQHRQRTRQRRDDRVGVVVMNADVVKHDPRLACSPHALHRRVGQVDTRLLQRQHRRDAHMPQSRQISRVDRCPEVEVRTQPPHASGVVMYAARIKAARTAHASGRQAGGPDLSSLRSSGYSVPSAGGELLQGTSDHLPRDDEFT